MAAEMRADLTDKSIWTYREEDDTPAQHATYLTVETRQGTLRRLIAFNGRHLSPRAAAIETTRINDYVHDRYAQEKAQRASAHDAAQARQLLQMLPDAFIWTIVKQTPENTTLRFQPNPQFNPPDTEARVMGAMSGEMVVARKGDRIRSLHGALTHNVLIGWGILARLYGGGTFDVERRLVGDGRWQITQTHVHIAGHALFFKTIGQQEDDVKTDWKPSTADTLVEAAHALDAEQ